MGNGLAVIGLVIFGMAILVGVLVDTSIKEDSRDIDDQVYLKWGDKCIKGFHGLSTEDYIKSEEFLCKYGYDCNALEVCS